jgi:hypothetical protein
MWAAAFTDLPRQARTGPGTTARIIPLANSAGLMGLPIVNSN